MMVVSTDETRADSAAEIGARGGGLRLRQAAVMATLLTVVGVFAVMSTGYYLWALWTTDPLKSIGGFVPIVSLVLILRAWRSIGWEMRGSWWGLAILVATVALVHLRDHAILELVLGPSWSIFLPPHSLVAFAYAAGAVLLFGGTRLFRAALFPVVLMWFVNPVPHAFTLWIDLPLQHISAYMARAFAHALGQKLSPDQLRLMFTPDFGMFIAPGCDGIRGAITMGFLALIAGYIYKFKPRVLAMVVLAAVALGYVFNLVRLCVLVLYYIVALHIHWLQSRAEMGDYIIGACLFFVATMLLFSAIRRWSPTGDLRVPAMPEMPAAMVGARAPRSFWWRWAALALVFGFGSVGYVRALMYVRPAARADADPKALGLFPKQVGQYKLEREWNESLVTGPLIFYWADYRPADGGAVVSVGISPVLGAHDTLLCHSARGEDWLWHGDLNFPTADGATSFSGSFFNDGATQYMEATTVCTGGTCGQYSSNRRHFGFVYSRPDTETLLTQSPTRPIPILLRTETLDTAMAADQARAQLTGNLRAFLAAARLGEFTQPYR
jgi:exosortase J